MLNSKKNHLPNISVVIPVFNDEEGLRLCLAALTEQSYPLTKVEVIVVDNGSSPPLELPDVFPFKLQSYRCMKPGSYASRNMAVSVSKGRFLAFTDADCRPGRDWLTEIIEYFNNHAETGAIGGCIVLEVSSKPSSAEFYEKIFSFRQKKCVLEYGFSFTANLSVRREVFDRVGAFNENLKSGGDREWGQRMQLAEERMDYVDTACVVHPARTTLSALAMKRRRLEGGRRLVPRLKDMDAEWRNKPSSGPPRGTRMGFTLIAFPQRLGITRCQGIKVLFVAMFLVVVGRLERIRLWFGGQELR